MTKYATWQGKRHKSFGPAQIDAAVTEFLDGPWAEKSDRFVLCVQASLRSTDALDKIEECAARLRGTGIEFQPLDGEQLNLRLKSLPQGRVAHDARCDGRTIISASHARVRSDAVGQLVNFQWLARPGARSLFLVFTHGSRRRLFIDHLFFEQVISGSPPLASYFTI
jgi:hypothetical protein